MTHVAYRKLITIPIASQVSQTIWHYVKFPISFPKSWIVKCLSSSAIPSIIHQGFLSYFSFLALKWRVLIPKSWLDHHQAKPSPWFLSLTYACGYVTILGRVARLLCEEFRMSRKFYYIIWNKGNGIYVYRGIPPKPAPKQLGNQVNICIKCTIPGKLWSIGWTSYLSFAVNHVDSLIASCTSC